VLQHFGVAEGSKKGLGRRRADDRAVEFARRGAAVVEGSCCHAMVHGLGEPAEIFVVEVADHPADAPSPLSGIKETSYPARGAIREPQTSRRR